MPSDNGHPQLQIPEALFHAIAFLLPALNSVAQECGITIGEWTMLWHISCGGTRSSGVKPVMLRQHLTQLLDRRGFGSANITRILNNLEDKGFIRRISLTQQQRDQLFEAVDGANRLAVALTDAGTGKINEFSLLLNKYCEAWYFDQPSEVQEAIQAATSMAPGLTAKFFKGLS